MAYDSGEDLYSNEMPSAPEQGESETEGQTKTELLPKSFFPGTPKPGKVCTIRVEQVMDDQVAVSYQHSSPGEKSEEMPMRDKDMEAMME